MKKYIILFFALFLLISCRSTEKQQTREKTSESEKSFEKSKESKNAESGKIAKIEESEKIEKKAEERTKFDSTATFVETERNEESKIFTVIIFDSILEVRADGRKIDSSDFEYEQVSGELKISGGKSFEIAGKYKNPPEFALQKNICKNPLVLYQGKTLVCGEDYSFSEEENLVKFFSQANLEEDSYGIFWFSENSDCSLTNNIEKFPEQSDFVMKWISENSQ